MDEMILEKLEFEGKSLASLSSRLWAYFIDSIICFLLAFFVFKYFSSSEDLQMLATYVNNEDYEPARALMANFIKVFIIIKFSYLILFFYLYGATLGNIITKTKIVNYTHLDTPDFMQSCLRAFLFMLCDLFLNGVLFLTVFFNKTRRHLVDLACKSVVIKVD